MNKVMTVIKEIPWQVWAIGGATIAVIFVFNKGFGSLIGQGASQLPTTVNNVEQAFVSAGENTTASLYSGAKAATKTITNDLIDQGLQDWAAIKTIVGVGGAGLATPSNN